MSRKFTKNHVGSTWLLDYMLNNILKKLVMFYFYDYDRISNFIKIRPEGAEVFHANSYTRRR
jgi:hypothetical protein